MPCSKATFIIEKKAEGSISRKENFQLHIHLAICKWCSAYNKKVELLNKILKNSFGKFSKEKIKNIDIQKFKENLIKKIDS